MRRVKSPRTTDIVLEAHASDEITNPFDFGEAGVSLVSARQNARRRARPFSAGLIIARLFCGLVGFVGGLLLTEVLIVQFLGGDLRAYMPYRDLCPVGGMLLGSLMGAIPGFFQTKS